MVVPLYAARVRDLRTGRSIAITCLCGHVGIVPVWLVRLKRPLDDRILDLGSWCRCRICHERGHVYVDAKRALGIL